MSRFCSIMLPFVLASCAGITAVERDGQCPDLGISLERSPLDQSSWQAIQKEAVDPAQVPMASREGVPDLSHFCRGAQIQRCTILNTGRHVVVLATRPERGSATRYTLAGLVHDLEERQSIPLDESRSPEDLSGAAVAPDGSIYVVARTRRIAGDTFDLYRFEPEIQRWHVVAKNACRGSARMAIIGDDLLLQIHDEMFCLTHLKTGQQCQWPGWTYAPQRVFFLPDGAALWGGRSAPPAYNPAIEATWQEPEVLQTGLEVKVGR